MKLKTVNNIFVLEDTTYNERHIPKTAGFRWHNTPGNCLGKCAACVSGIGRVWWTNIPSNALLLRECADEEAIKVLDKTQEEIERSRAFEPTIDIDLPVPAGKDYLPYQKAGIIYSLTKDRVLIGDVMGLGKTIQSIGVLNALPEMADRCLIVAPPSLRTNWTNEINAWKTRDWTVHNVDKTKDIVDNKHLITRDGIKRIFVISYNQVTGQRAAEARNFILSLRWNLVVVDEAHLYKNPKSQRSKAILGTYTKDSLSTPGVAHVTDKLLLLTGTAIANRPVELFPLLRVLDPNGLGSSFMRYAHRYCAAHRGRFGWDFSGSSNLTELQEVLRSGIMIRRNKEEVLKDLPTKTRHIVELDADGAKSLVEKQANAYLKHEEAINYLEDCIDLANEIDDKEAFKEASSLLQEAHQTAFKDMARERKALAVAKVPVVIEHVENILESCDSSVLVFAHHKEVVAKLKEHFKTNLVITGDTPTTKRQGIVEAFQRKEHRVFIGNIISAGVGLTLTAADKVVFAELDWVPANMLQAEDRAHRISQQNQVLVQYLVFNGSIDAKMAKILVSKMEVIEKALDKSSDKDHDRRAYLAMTKEKSTKTKKNFQPLTDEQKKIAEEVIMQLDNACDGARKNDGAGFNKVDALFGRTLAERAKSRGLSDAEANAAKKIIQKYRRQVDNEYLGILFGAEMAMGGEECRSMLG